MRRKLVTWQYTIYIAVGILFLVLCTVGRSSTPKYEVNVGSDMDIYRVNVDVEGRSATVTMASPSILILFKTPLRSSKLTSLCVSLEEECIRLMKLNGTIE